MPVIGYRFSARARVLQGVLHPKTATMAKTKSNNRKSGKKLKANHSDKWAMVGDGRPEKPGQNGEGEVGNGDHHRHLYHHQIGRHRSLLQNRWHTETETQTMRVNNVNESFSNVCRESKSVQFQLADYT